MFGLSTGHLEFGYSAGELSTLVCTASFSCASASLIVSLCLCVAVDSPPGTWNPFFGKTSCISCPLGSAQATSGASECNNCTCTRTPDPLIVCRTQYVPCLSFAVQSALSILR